MSDTYLSIIIPAHNEAARIDPTLSRLVGWFRKQQHMWRIRYEIIVVCNGCTDNTAEVVSNWYGQGVWAIELDTPGKWNAIRVGMLEASGQYRYMCDADLSVDPESIHHFISYLLSHGADIAYGDRELGARSNESWGTHLRGRAFNSLVQLLALPGVRDSQCGFKLFTAASAERLFRLPLIVPGWAGDVEIMYLARRAGMRLVATPVVWRHDQRSHVRNGDSWQMLKDITRVRIHDLQGYYSKTAVARNR